MIRKIALVAVSVAMLGACGDDSAGTGEDNLTQGGKAIIGSYIERGGGQFRSLVLTSEKASSNANRFFADIDTGIKCITTPCPSMERVEGTFTAGTKTITLKSTTASSHVQSLLGKFNYKVSGEKLSLSRKGFDQSLEEVLSYCAAESAESDCDAQGLIHPECVGGWSCSEEASCQWSCGGPDPGFCPDGTVVDGADTFVPSAEDDNTECRMPSVHCVTKDQGACPQLSPLPRDFCKDGTIVEGADSFIPSADDMECQMPSIHCVTKDFDACPQLTPLPPDYCEDGTIAKGPDTFIPSADGMECQHPSIHCLTKNLDACPQF